MDGRIGLYQVFNRFTKINSDRNTRYTRIQKSNFINVKNRYEIYLLDMTKGSKDKENFGDKEGEEGKLEISQWANEGKNNTYSMQ